jgi:hypothetical protein
MKTLLLSFVMLILVAGQATAQSVVPAMRLSNSSVNVCLPSLPSGSEYHSVWISYGDIVDDKPLQLGDRNYVIQTELNRGGLTGIVCTSETCTPFKYDWAVTDSFDPDELVPWYAQTHVKEIVGKLFGGFVVAAVIVAFLLHLKRHRLL